MVFSSFPFLGLFLPIVLIAYFGVTFSTRNIKASNRVLLAASLVFYAWGEPLWLSILVCVAFSDYAIGKRIAAATDAALRKRLVLASLIIDLGALFAFKYLGFAVSVVNGVFRASLPNVSIALPIGISFYVFQSLSYILDVYGGKIEAQTSFADYILFVSMFPQLVAGPIVRYADIAEQLRIRQASLEGFAKGARRFCAGLCKKIVLANQFGAAASVLLDGGLSGLSMAGAWLGALLFAMQIYFDFSGYSDMAIGLGRMFGFTYKENFDYPYISRSITEFWRRWHISLGSFFRDYVYIPLGGNRRFAIRNLMIVWCLTGLWHGASWNFVLWGLYYGAFLIAEKQAGAKGLSLPRPLAWLATMAIVLFGWGLFYFTDASRLMAFCRGFFGMNGLYASQHLKVTTVWFQNAWLLAVGLVASTPLPRKLYQRYVENRATVSLPFHALAILGAVALCFTLLVAESYNPFLYFRF